MSPFDLDLDLDLDLDHQLILPALCYHMLTTHDLLIWPYFSFKPLKLAGIY